ncbi:flavin reductase family protein [Chenggangzhangella methanolivorans]|uniref:flavin reductase family protein n=1 Tax=Chenggangzhangella methanolivorans TaxID=1437009 RepID=UPI0028F4126D|nr:flavin reductase family protein [Chenggangzhangella methanolivorans]
MTILETRSAPPSAPASRHFDFGAMAAEDRYRLLTAAVLPRPIAWVTSASPAGEINAAPYSFFNVFGSDRPVVALGVLARPERPKDTAANIRATAEFVVNLVPYELAEAMNVTCVDAPAGVDELDLAGLDRGERRGRASAHRSLPGRVRVPADP